TGMNLYVFAGGGAMIYDTKIDALDGNNQVYNFNSIPTGFYADRKKLKKAVRNLLDGTYESEAEKDPLRAKLFGQSFRPVFDMGVGLQFKLNKKLSLSIEEKFSLPLKTDLLDGQQWQNNQPEFPSMTRDHDAY